TPSRRSFTASGGASPALGAGGVGSSLWARPAELSSDSEQASRPPVRRVARVIGPTAPSLGRATHGFGSKFRSARLGSLLASVQMAGIIRSPGHSPSRCPRLRLEEGLRAFEKLEKALASSPASFLSLRIVIWPALGSWGWGLPLLPLK